MQKASQVIKRVFEVCNVGGFVIKQPVHFRPRTFDLIKEMDVKGQCVMRESV